MFEKLKFILKTFYPRKADKNKVSHKLKPQVFHGGCLSCTSQRDKGIERCIDCRYHNFDLDKPDLSINDSDFHLGMWIKNQSNKPSLKSIKIVNL